jgi:F-type H+-transporting ATPase subunit delta
MTSTIQEAARQETVLDSSEQRVASGYAEALLTASDRRNETDSVMQEFDSLLTDVLPTEPRFEEFLSSGAIGRIPKAEAIRNAFSARASEIFLNFLLVLNDHDRLDLLRGIYRAAKNIYDRRAGRVPVVVRSAVPLPDEQRDHLLKRLRETLKKEPVLSLRVDPDLLGGMTVQVGDWVYDNSVRTRLDELRKQLIERGSHVQTV